MTNGDSISTQVRNDLMRYLNRGVATKEEFTDKIRTVIIIILTSNDTKFINEAIQALKTC